MSLLTVSLPERTSIRVPSPFHSVDCAKYQFHQLKVEITDLEAQKSFLVDRKVSDGAFWENASDDDIVRSAIKGDEACLCPSCVSEAVTKSYQRRIENGEKYEARLTHQLEPPEELRKASATPEVEQHSSGKE